MWNSVYRTPTECWQKTSHFPKGKKIPTYLGRAKEKEKKETKELRWDQPLWEGGVKDEKFPHTRKPPYGRDGVGAFGASEERATTEMWRAEHRDSHMEDQCRPALTNLRCLSADKRVGVGS